MYITMDQARVMKEEFDSGESSYSGNIGGFVFNIVGGYGDKGMRSLDIAQLDGGMKRRITLITNIYKIMMGDSKISIVNEDDITVTIPIRDDNPNGKTDAGCDEIRCPRCNKKINMDVVKSFKMIKANGLSCTYGIRCPSCDTELKYTEKMMCVKKDIEVKE